MADQMGSDSLLNQADSMWKMLDDLAESDPDAYKKFIDKALKDGATSFKPPEPCFCISTILVSRATGTFTFLPHFLRHFNPGGGTLGISGWGCPAGTLEPLAYTRASSAEFCYLLE